MLSRLNKLFYFQSNLCLQLLNDPRILCKFSEKVLQLDFSDSNNYKIFSQ